MLMLSTCCTTTASSTIVATATDSSSRTKNKELPQGREHQVSSLFMLRDDQEQTQQQQDTNQDVAADDVAATPSTHRETTRNLKKYGYYSGGKKGYGLYNSPYYTPNGSYFYGGKKHSNNYNNIFYHGGKNTKNSWYESTDSATHSTASSTTGFYFSDSWTSFPHTDDCGTATKQNYYHCDKVVRPAHFVWSQYRIRYQ